MTDDLRELVEVLDEHQLNSSGECSCDGTFRPDDIQAQHQIDALKPMLREHVAKAELRADARARVEEIKRRGLAEAEHRSNLTMMLKETEWQINKDLGSQWLAGELYDRGARAPFGHFHPSEAADE